MPPRDESGPGRLLATIAAGIVALGACASQRDGTREPRGLAAEPGDSAKERLYFIDGKAGRLRISDGGHEGTPVLFLHGLGCRIDCWRAQLDHLRPFRRAVTYDQRGHGDSDRARDGVYTIAALAEDLEAVVDDRLAVVTAMALAEALPGGLRVHLQIEDGIQRPVERRQHGIQRLRLG